MRSPFPRLAVFVTLVATGCAAPAVPVPVALFNGHDFAGWEFVTVPAKAIDTVCTLKPDGVIAAVGTPLGFLATAETYTNYRLHAEWRWPGKPGNGGVLLHIASGPKDRAWPVSLQVQLKTKVVGDLLPMAGATFAEPLTSAPGATPTRARAAPDSEKPAGEWNSCDITCRDGTVEVTINGVVQNKVTGVTPRTGRLGFQFEGTAFELRAVSVVRLD